MMLQFTYTDTNLISELQYKFTGVLECKFNLDGELWTDYNENKQTWFSPMYNKKTQNIISKNVGTTLIIK